MLSGIIYSIYFCPSGASGYWIWSPLIWGSHVARLAQVDLFERPLARIQDEKSDPGSDPGSGQESWTPSAQGLIQGRVRWAKPSGLNGGCRSDVSPETLSSRRKRTAQSSSNKLFLCFRVCHFASKKSSLWEINVRKGICQSGGFRKNCWAWCTH